MRLAGHVARMGKNKNALIYLLTAIGLTPVAVVHYTFTRKQYTEQHNETEYTE
jgi:hypothetical protein